MNINSRIKFLRKRLNLSQIEFASKMGIKQSSLSDIENGKTVNIDERNIKIICQAHNVNEAWLRDGTGEIFNDFNNSFEDLILSSIGQLDEIDRKIISEYIKLKSAHRAVVKEFIRKFI
jgi:transcriptional regulator with XRE-family HTH domain